MNKTYAEALDEILDGIINAETLRFVSDEHEYFQKLRERVIEKYKLKKGEYELLIDKLEDDKLIKRIGQPFEHYEIYFKGMDWISPEIGGYVQERQNAIDDRVYERNFDKTVKRNAVRLTWGTWGLVAATLGLVAWEMYKTFCIEQHGCY